MNLNERIRQLQQEERQRVADQQKQLALRQQEEQLRMQKDAELRNATEKQREEAREKFFGILDNLQVRQKLEEVKHQVWQGQGNVVEDRSDSIRSIKLLFDFKTQIPETEIKQWTEAKTVYGQSQGGQPATFTEFDNKSKYRDIAWHEAVKSSYLEVGINMKPVSFRVSYNNRLPSKDYENFFATFYIADTDAGELSVTEAGLRRLSNLGNGIESFSRDEYYRDKSGKPFDKRPRRSREEHSSSVFPTTYGYLISRNFKAYGVRLGLTFDVNEGLVTEFLEHSLALSSAMRIAQHKLPLQLKQS